MPQRIIKTSSMKLFVFSIQHVKVKTLLNINADMYRIKILLGGGAALWTDDDTTIPDTEAAIRENYLEPNNIPVLKMGKIDDMYWAVVDNNKIKFEEFYTYEEAVATNLFNEDPSALCWKDFFIFLNAETGDDLIGSYNYLETVIKPIQYIIREYICPAVSVTT
jgi:hypothetical protein